LFVAAKAKTKSMRKPSALKRARQTIKRTERNTAAKSAVKTQIRRVRDAIAKGDHAAAEAELKKASSVLQKTAGKGVLKKENASRRLGRLAAAAAKAKAAPAKA